MEIIKSFNGNTEAEIKSGGFKIFIEWEELIPALERCTKLRPDEILEGCIVDDTGLNVLVGRKLGRKRSDKTIEVDE
jgi:hypothetical protein